MEEITSYFDKYNVSDVIVKDFTTVPVIGEEYYNDHFYIGLCRRGWVKGHSDYLEVPFNAGDVCVVLPGHILSHEAVSDDYLTTAVGVSRNFYKKLLSSHVLRQFIAYNSYSKLSLNEQQCRQVLDIFHLLDGFTKGTIPHREELIVDMFGVLLQLLNSYQEASHEVFMPMNSGGQLFIEFYDAIMEHYRDSREVIFYASLFHRTPKYFAKIIKETTGVAATEWISRYVIIEARRLLKWEPNRTIQQISDQLGFSEQAAFCTYFKKHIGMTPMQFRTASR
ncbi:MAG: helix-turn-helix transcriptional regulator [Prevotella sp.]|nr:helix-turn-helix transcriptional regulator [Prevotella sp.]